MQLTNLGWLYVDFVTPLDPSYPDFEEDFPFQAVQANSRSDCPRPPFKLDKGFKIAFKESVAEFGAEKLDRIRSLKPPEGFLDLIGHKMMVSDQQT